MLPAGAISTYWLLSCLFSGSYFPSAWYPAAIVTVVLAALLVAAGWRLPRGGTAAAFALLAGFVAWTILSIAWADAGGHALEAGNNLIFALATTFVFALTPWTRSRATWLLGYLAIGISIACAVSLISAAMAKDPTDTFIGGRYSDPLGYAGASAAFAAISVWLSLSFAVRRSLPIWVRSIAFGVAALQVALALLPESRGVLIGFACAFLLFLAISPSRGWSIVYVLCLAAIVAATVGPILDVYAVANGTGSVHDALGRAAWRIPLILAVGTAAGVALVLLEGRRPELLSAEIARRSRIPVAVAVAIGIVILIVGFGGRISDQVSSHWDEFKAGKISRHANHLTALQDSGRYDYWRVALDAFDEKPITGIGAGNFQDAYTLHRHDEKQSRYAHNLWFRVLSETGIVGLLLIVGSLGIAIVTLCRRRSGLSPPIRCLVAGAAAAAVQVFAHASVDWIEEFPVNLGIALGVLFLACRLAQPPAGPGRRGPWPAVATAVAAAAALVLLVPAYLSLRFVSHAENIWPTQPAAAYSDLNRAADLNPLSSEPFLKAAEIAIARKERKRARLELEAAISREENWYPFFELAIVSSEEGKQKAAIREMETAQRMDPPDALEKYNLQYLREDGRLTAERVREEITEETVGRIFHLRQEVSDKKLEEQEEAERKALEGK